MGPVLYDIIQTTKSLWKIDEKPDKEAELIFKTESVTELNNYFLSKKKFWSDKQNKDELNTMKLYFHEKIINGLKSFIKANVENGLEDLTDPLVRFYQEYNVKFYKELTGFGKEAEYKTAEKEYYFKVKSLDALMQAEKYQKEQIYRLARKFNVDFDNKKTLDQNLDVLQNHIDNDLDEEKQTKIVVDAITKDVRDLGEKIGIEKQVRNIWLKREGEEEE